MDFQKIKISGWQFKLADDFPAEFSAGIIDTFQDGQRSSFEKLPSSKFAQVFKFNVYFKGKIYNLILKQYLDRSGLDILKNLMLPCRAYRAFKAGRMLKQYGFSSPDVVAAGRKTLAGITIKNFLITGEIRDSTPLYKRLNTEISQKQTSASSAEPQLISQFGQTIGRMHAQNIFHGDLRLGNVLVKNNGNKFEFIFLDNERTKKFRKLPLRLRLKNLVQVCLIPEYINDADRATFLNAYMAEQNVKIDSENLAAQIAAGVKKRLAAKEIKTV
jgi:serine/threonine protein kinase